jgi:T3SS negative regulator,GrlR
MPGIEALYVVEFGDVGGQGYRNGGVAVLETNRIFGGDSGYYYVGTYNIKDNHIEATAKVVKHNPSFANVFGDASLSFNIKMSGTVDAGGMQGFMERHGRIDQHFDFQFGSPGKKICPKPGQRVIPEIDIWRAANLLIRKHGANAELEAAKRADLMLDRGDDEGRLLWAPDQRAIEALQAPRHGESN